MSGGNDSPSSSRFLDGDETEARAAIEMAQLGELSSASEILVSLRARHPSGHSVRIAVWILLLEAAIWYYADRKVQSLDRAHRALVLASASDTQDLAAESAVLLSHLCFNFERYDLLVKALNIGFDGFDKLGDGPRARICLVIADSCQFLGNPEAASKWYQYARFFSRRSGTRSVVAAIEFNRIAMALSRLRLERFVPVRVVSEFHKDWLREILSIQRLHQGFGVTSLAEFLLLGESLAQQSQGNFAASAKALSEIQSRQAAHLCGLSESMLQLEIDWCLTLAGDATETLILRVPELNKIGEWSSSEQVIALKQFEDIYRAFDQEFDRAELERLHAAAVEQCLLVDSQLETAITSCLALAYDVERLVHPS